MSIAKKYQVNPDLAALANIDLPGYEADYAESVRDPDAYWARQAEKLSLIHI